jgi:hypothetical protein
VTSAENPTDLLVPGSGGQRREWEWRVLDGRGGLGQLSEGFGLKMLG